MGRIDARQNSFPYLLANFLFVASGLSNHSPLGVSPVQSDIIRMVESSLHPFGQHDAAMSDWTGTEAEDTGLVWASEMAEFGSAGMSQYSHHPSHASHPSSLFPTHISHHMHHHPTDYHPTSVISTIAAVTTSTTDIYGPHPHHHQGHLPPQYYGAPQGSYAIYPNHFPNGVPSHPSSPHQFANSSTNTSYFHPLPTQTRQYHTRSRDPGSQRLPPIRPYEHPMAPSSVAAQASPYPSSPKSSTTPIKRRKKSPSNDVSVSQKLFSLSNLKTDVRYGLEQKSFYRLKIASSVLDTYNPWFWLDVNVPDERYRHLENWFNPMSPAPSVDKTLRLANGTTLNMPRLLLFSDDHVQTARSDACGGKGQKVHSNTSALYNPAEMTKIPLPATGSKVLVTKPFDTSSNLKVPCWSISKTPACSDSFVAEILSEEEFEALKMSDTNMVKLEMGVHHAKKHIVLMRECGTWKHKHSINFRKIANILVYPVVVEGTSRPMVAVTLALNARGDDSCKSLAKTAAPACACPPIMPDFCRPVRPRSQSGGGHPDFESRERHAGEFYVTVLMDRGCFIDNVRGKSACSPMGRMVLGDPYLASITMVQMQDVSIGLDRVECRSPSLWVLRDRLAYFFDFLYHCLKFYGPDQLSLMLNRNLKHLFRWVRCTLECCRGKSSCRSGSASFKPGETDYALRSVNGAEESHDEMLSEGVESDETTAYLDVSSEDSVPVNVYVNATREVSSMNANELSAAEDIGDGEMTDDGDYDIESDDVDEYCEEDDEDDDEGGGRHYTKKSRQSRNGKKRGRSVKSRDLDVLSDEDELMMSGAQTLRKRRKASKRSKCDAVMGAVPEDTFAFNFSDAAAIAEYLGVEIPSKEEVMYTIEALRIGAPGICNYHRTFMDMGHRGEIRMPLKDLNTIDPAKLEPVEVWNMQFTKDSSAQPTYKTEPVLNLPKEPIATSENMCHMDGMQLESDFGDASSPFYSIMGYHDDALPNGSLHPTATATSPSAPPLDNEILDGNKKRINRKSPANSPQIRVGIELSKNHLVRVFGPGIEKLWKDFE